MDYGQDQERTRKKTGRNSRYSLQKQKTEVTVTVNPPPAN
jgi:hypothetical protein